MKLRKQSLILSVAGLALGLVGGYFYADYYNRTGSVSPLPGTQMSAGQLPADHPPVNRVSPEEVAAAKKNAESNPNDFDAQISTAEVLYQANQLDEAAEFYERAQRLRPDDYDTLVKLGNAHFDIGLQEYQQQSSDHSSKHFQDAAKWYEQALAKNPSDVNVRTDYGLTFYFREPKDLEQAIAQYDLSLKVDPNHPQTLANLLIALTEQGKINEAKDTLGKLATTAAGTPLLERTIAHFTLELAEQGKWEEAELALSRLQALFPNTPTLAPLRQEIETKRGTKIQPH